MSRPELSEVEYLVRPLFIKQFQSRNPCNEPRDLFIFCGGRDVLHGMPLAYA